MSEREKNYESLLYLKDALVFVAVMKYLRKQLKGGRIYFGSLYQRFQSMFTCCFASRPVCGEVEHHCREDVIEQNGLPHGRDRWKRWRTRYGPKGMPPVNYFQLAPTSKSFHHLPLMSSDNESIRGLIC
jgi:hypothetical protein